MSAEPRHHRCSEKTRRVPVVLLVCACLLTYALPAGAAELWSDASGERSVSLNTSLKWTSVLSHASGDTVFFLSLAGEGWVLLNSGHSGKAQRVVPQRLGTIVIAKRKAHEVSQFPGRIAHRRIGTEEQIARIVFLDNGAR